MTDRRDTWRALLKWACGCALAVVLAAMVGRPDFPPRTAEAGALPAILPENARVQEGQAVFIKATNGDQLWVSLDGRIAHASRHEEAMHLKAEPDRLRIERALATPTAMQWRHPKPGLPAAMVVRAAEANDGRATGPYAMRTYLFAQHALPVLSLSCDPDGLLGEEDGILVPGNGILRLPEQVQRFLAKDRRWWKYPGNYHGRGKAWEREARVQLINQQGNEILQADAGIRINGQMTRGFPQHALRLLFREPLRTAPFSDGDGAGSRSLVLRTAGNDQVKAMLRDAYQHKLCEGLPFDTRKALTCVAYFNGAYQGVHHLRQRIDEQEISRRYGVPAKHITILEDHNRLYRGDSSESKSFARMVVRAERWDGRSGAWADSLEALLDVDGFLTYMASQMILGNMDWPKQNVMYWRYTGAPKGGGPFDGRWRFVMGDSDLGFGANAGASADLFVKVKGTDAPVARLLLAMLRHPALHDRFVAKGLALLDQQLSAERCVAVLDSMAAAMGPEMEYHCMRWRKPADVGRWKAEVEVVRAYALAREAEARRQFNALARP